MQVSPGGFVIVDGYSPWADLPSSCGPASRSHCVKAERTWVAGGAVFWRVPLHELLAGNNPREGTKA
jgi:hypothetical protein